TAQDIGVLLAHFGKNTHAQPRAGEWVAIDHVVGQAQLQADLAYFVLEQLAQRLDQFKGHVIGQAANVVVRLDHVGLAGLGASGFDHVGVDGALGQELDVLQFGGLFIEDLDEGATDDLALGFRVGNAQQTGEELLLGVGADYRHPHALGEHGHDLLAFVQAQQAVVDKDAGQLFTDGTVQQRGNHRRVHPAGQAEQHLGTAHLGADIGDGVFDDIGRGPQGFTAAQIKNEAGQDTQPLLGVGHFRVELHAVELAGVIAHGSDGAARGAGQHLKAIRQVDDLVAMAHPYVEAEHAIVRDRVFDAVEEAALADQVDPRITEFTLFGTLHSPAQLGRHGLHAVADTQYRHAQLEDHLRRPRAAGFRHRLRATGEHYTLGGKGADCRFVHIPGMDFTVDADFTYPPCNQLGVLGAEIQDQDAVSMN